MFCTCTRACRSRLRSMTAKMLTPRRALFGRHGATCQRAGARCNAQVNAVSVTRTQRSSLCRALSDLTRTASRAPSSGAQCLLRSEAHVVLSDSIMCLQAALRAHAKKDPSQRIVITGMGVVSCFGNDVDTFYDKCDHSCSLCVVAAHCSGRGLSGSCAAECRQQCQFACFHHDNVNGRHPHPPQAVCIEPIMCSHSVGAAQQRAWACCKADV